MKTQVNANSLTNLLKASCPQFTILNTLDYLVKFDGKSDEGFFVGYSLNSKTFRVYNIRTGKVEENLLIRFLEDKPIIAGDGPKWLFDIDVLTKSMNYVPIFTGINSNDIVGWMVKKYILYARLRGSYVYQTTSFEDPEFPDKVYKVEKALYGLHQAPRAWYETLSTYLLDNGFQRGQIDKTLFIKRAKEIITQKYDGIFISQDKCDDKILKKFGFSTMKTASTPVETSKPSMKDENDEDVDIHLYRSMIIDVFNIFKA
ncbi:ribonuclease H-like domain-containing protein [Tanacetum coccineum]